ncbi:MAG: hypothetical protein LBQ75_01165 [Zoogloeaceae bacterium]|jgi:hypothetical protein|nr:hypothetical protein [Zoogloeaceae bacterium]
MGYVRFLALLLVIVIGLGFFAYALTNDHRYWRLSWRLLKGMLIFALIFFGLLFLERLALIPAVAL